jgi:hypothetical protein
MITTITGSRIRMRISEKLSVVGPLSTLSTVSALLLSLFAFSASARAQGAASQPAQPVPAAQAQPPAAPSPASAGPVEPSMLPPAGSQPAGTVQSTFPSTQPQQQQQQQQQNWYPPAPQQPNGYSPSSQQPNWYPPAPQQPSGHPTYQAYPPPAPAPSGYYPPTSPGSPPQPYSYPTATFAPLDDRPNILDYDSSKPIPPGYTVEKRLRKGLLISGGVTLGLGYLFSLVWADAAEQETANGGHDPRVNATLLYIPILGPWIAIPTAHNGCGDVSCKDDRRNAITGLVLLGTAQAVGATLLAFGFVPSKRLVRSDLTVTPVFMGQSGYGIGMFGPL